MENQNPTYSTQKEEPISFPEKPKTMGTPSHPFPKFLPKPIALIIIVIFFSVFISGLIITVYNLGRNSVLKELNPTAPVIPPADPVTQATPSLDETTGWKTYEGNGFSFRYPTDWNISNGFFQDTVNLEFGFQDYADYTKNEDYRLADKKEEINVSGYKATKVMGYTGIGGSVYYLNTYINLDNKTFNFTASTFGEGNPAEDKQVEEKYNQILSTFRFD